MATCNAANNRVCRKYFYECTGAGADLNGCPEWAIVHALQELNKNIITLTQEGIGV